LGAATTAYTTTGETSGAGYTAGGNTLTGVTVLTSGTTAYVDFANPVWTSASFTARGALIYNASKSNKAIAVLDFGSDKTTTTTFTVQMPANTASSALIRIA
jgi:VCBS repeat-containing protein